jgi:hypothetical protein
LIAGDFSDNHGKFRAQSQLIGETSMSFKKLKEILLVKIGAAVQKDIRSSAAAA